MKELLPLVLGVIVGLTAALVRPKLQLLCLASLAMGALASAVNGELESGLAPLFVSFDALLVWAAAVLTLAGVWSHRRRGADVS
jgi:hypothetical protein